MYCNNRYCNKNLLVKYMDTNKNICEICFSIYVNNCDICGLVCNNTCLELFTNALKIK